jgi:hypothetical protein
LLRFWLAIGAYAAVLFGVLHWLNIAPPEGGLRYAAALSPAVPILALLWAMGAYLHEEADEFRRAVLVQSMLWGVALVLAFSTVWGFLELFSNVPRFPLYLMFPLFCLGMGVSQPFVARRYK